MTLSRPVLAFFLREGLKSTLFGVSTLTIGYLGGRAVGSAFTAGAARGRLVRIMPLIGFGGIGLIFPVYSLVGRWYYASGLRLVQGILAGVSWPIVQTALSMAAPPKLRSTYMTAYFVGGALAIPAANFSYAAALSRWPLISQTALSGVLFVILAVLAFLVLGGFEDLPWVRKEVGFRGVNTDLILLALFLNIVVCIRGSELLYVFVRENLDMTKEEAAALVGVADSVSIGAEAVFGVFADFLGRERILLVSVFLASLAPFMALRSTAVLLLALISISTASRAFLPVSRALASYSENPASSIGLLNAFGNGGVVLGQALLGLSSLYVPLFALPLLLIPFSGLLVLRGLSLVRGPRGRIPSRSPPST